MDLDRVEFEVQRAARHIEAPQPRLGLPDQRHGLVPMTAESRVPMMQRQRVMLTQVLLMDDLEALGATAIIQPGGSIRDQESIDMANKYGIAMVFTGHRHFRHS